MSFKNKELEEEYWDRLYYLEKSKKVYKGFYYLFMTSFLILLIIAVANQGYSNRDTKELYLILAAIMFGISRIFKYKVNDKESRIFSLELEKRLDEL